jgi:hypothetical protein
MHLFTQPLAEFQELIHHSGLCLTDKDRVTMEAMRKARLREEKRKRYAAGNYEECEDELSSGLSNELTETEIRQAFACSQDDDEEGLTETSELVFAEFVESVAR